MNAELAIYSFAGFVSIYFAALIFMTRRDS
jgi:hypothetical protein